jgi:hypothetical protein
VAQEPVRTTLRALELQEHGFRGSLQIVDVDGALRVEVIGIDPSDGTALEKDVPAARDERLDALVKACLQGDDAAATEILSQVGIVARRP